MIILCRIYSLLLLLLPAMLTQAYNYDLTSIRKLGLPVVEISTVNGEMPTCEYVTHPEGSMGQSITNAKKVKGRLCITLSGDTLYDSGEYVKNKSGMTIKINGNTSAYRDNKPYKIKLQKKADLLLRGSGKYKDEEWRLLKDAVSLNTMVGLKVNELIGMQWTPAYSYCNVMLNNKYQGCYMLIESVKRNPFCRINVSNKGYIIERDAYWWNENVYFKSNYFSDGRYGWTFKEPDEDDVTKEQINYIQGVVNNAEDAIFNGKYDKYIDTHSFAAWLLAHDILGTGDTGGSNLYITKYDNTTHSKLTMGCLWDFDTIFRTGVEKWNNFHTNNKDFYFDTLLSSSNTTFISEYRYMWETLSPTLYKEIENMLIDFQKSETSASLQLSREYYNKYYYKYYPSISQEVVKILDWFKKRTRWLDGKINKVNVEHSINKASEYIIDSDIDIDSYMYNLDE